MTQVITIETKTVEDILKTLQEIKEDVSSLKKTLRRRSFYGSSKWWETETKNALEEVKKGNVVKFDSVEDLIQDLHS